MTPAQEPKQEPTQGFSYDWKQKHRYHAVIAAEAEAAEAVAAEAAEAAEAKQLAECTCRGVSAGPSLEDPGSSRWVQIVTNNSR